MFGIVVNCIAVLLVSVLSFGLKQKIAEQYF